MKHIKKDLVITTCDSCGKTDTRHILSFVGAEDCGWAIVGDKNLCPECSDAKPNNMKKGTWDGSPIEYEVLNVNILPVNDRPLHWQNAFVGTIRQAVRIQSEKYLGESFLDNGDGSGLRKVLLGGWPNNYHAGISNCEILGEVPEAEWNQWDKEKYLAEHALVEAWQEANHPEEFKKLQALKEAFKSRWPKL